MRLTSLVRFSFSLWQVMAAQEAAGSLRPKDIEWRIGA